MKQFQRVNPPILNLSFFTLQFRKTSNNTKLYCLYAHPCTSVYQKVVAYHCHSYGRKILPVRHKAYKCLPLYERTSYYLQCSLKCKSEFLSSSIGIKLSCVISYSYNCPFAGSKLNLAVVALWSGYVSCRLKSYVAE